jgi:hypothetical protein
MRDRVAVMPYVFRRGAELFVEVDVIPNIRPIVILNGEKEGDGE